MRHSGRIGTSFSEASNPVFIGGRWWIRSKGELVKPELESRVLKKNSNAIRDLLGKRGHSNQSAELETENARMWIKRTELAFDQWNTAQMMRNTLKNMNSK